MKQKDAQLLIKNLTERGYVFFNGRYHTPAEAARLGIEPTKKKRRKKGTAPRYSDKKDDFCFYVKLEAGLDLVTEYRFDNVRKWRFDYANEEFKIAIEQEGGVWSGGRHTRGKGYINDMEKYNTAALHGWTLIRRTPDQMKTQETIQLIKTALKK